MHSITNESGSETSKEDQDADKENMVVITKQMQDTVSCVKVTKASARGMKGAEHGA
jgi:hypothetical protein